MEVVLKGMVIQGVPYFEILAFKMKGSSIQFFWVKFVAYINIHFSKIKKTIP